MGIVVVLYVDVDFLNSLETTSIHNKTDRLALNLIQQKHLVAMVAISQKNQNESYFNLSQFGIGTVFCVI